MNHGAGIRRLVYLQALGITAWRRRPPAQHRAAPSAVAPEATASARSGDRAQQWRLWVADAAAAARWRRLLEDLCRLLNGCDSAVDEAVAVGEPPPAGAVLVLFDPDREPPAAARPVVRAGDPAHWSGDAEAKRALWRRLQGYL